MCNRCERGHTLLSTAMQGWHLGRFIEDIGTSKEAINNIHQWIKSKKTNCARNTKQFNNAIHKIQGGNIRRDEEKDCPILNDLLLNRWSHISNVRAMKSNDIPLYSYALFQVIPIFFTTNHHNYPDGRHFMH